MAFKDNLKSELKYQEISIKELAYRTDISKSTLSSILYNDTMPLADKAVRIAKALGVTVEYLVTGEDKLVGLTKL